MIKMRNVLGISVLLVGGLMASIYILSEPVIIFNDLQTFEYSLEPRALEGLFNAEESRFDTLSITNDKGVLEALGLDEIGDFNLTIEAKKGIRTSHFDVAYKVVDTVVPIINGVQEMEVKFATQANFEHIEASDPIDGALEVKIEGEYDIKKAGTYELSAQATDRHGNVSQEIFTLKVQEEVKPIIPNKPVAEKNDSTPKKEVPATKNITYVQGHVFVNKKFGLPHDYQPGENPKARESVNRLIEAMIGLDFDISREVSGYRSYARQKQLYDAAVKADGVAKADTYIARPGHSEHQSGLTFDLKHRNGQLMGRYNPDSARAEIDWVAQNAHTYGFVVRYPQGQEGITGFMYEPWHLRYLGEELATKVYQSGLTMEAYFNQVGGGY